MPRIIGYLLTGLVFGPYFFRFVTQQTMVDLGFLNSLALAFIAFCAGRELKISNIAHHLKSILFLITGVTMVVFSA